MKKSFFERLKSGEKFPVSVLAGERDSVKLFWDWWWFKRPLNILDRPQTVEDGDPWLQPTNEKGFADTESYREYLTEFALYLQRTGGLRRGMKVPRDEYRQDLMNHMVIKSCTRVPPCIVFSGGGYGAGKTTIVDFLIRSEQLPIPQGAMMGVDFFKNYMPEFGLLQQLADGRGSSVVQNECRNLANNLFMSLVDEGRSFGWDSSMSTEESTLQMLLKARDKGYQLILVAVFAPLAMAIERAMLRAKFGRRFAHPEHLAPSHNGFQLSFKKYVPFFNEVFAFVNNGTAGTKEKPNALLAAYKEYTNGELAVFSPTEFDKFVDKRVDS